VHPCTRCIGASLHGTPSEAGGSMRALVEPERRFMPPASCGHSCASMRSRHSGFLPSTAPTVSLVFAFPPLMAHPSTDKLWASARRGADRTSAPVPPREGSRVGTRGTQSCRAQDQCAIGARFLLVTFLSREQRKVTRGYGGGTPRVFYFIWAALLNSRHLRRVGSISVTEAMDGRERRHSCTSQLPTIKAPPTAAR
jgi:hypothetical protein